MDNISFITFTNYGYLHYTKNLILSLEKCNFSLPLKIYCIDHKSYNELEKWNKNIILEMLNDETNTNENIVGWKKKGWNTMVFSKLKCIHKELLQNQYVFFTDSDIVFEKDCLQYLIDTLKNYDMLIQQNIEKKYPLNSGFMFIQSNESMKNLFDWTKINIKTFTCDQDYINDNSNNFSFYKLSMNLFPVEYHYLSNYSNLNKDIYIIHFNYYRANEKIKRMMNLYKWYINNINLVE